jgi:GNAT superfamily N-acetyltransferase
MRDGTRQIFCDQSLARRLERAEAHASSRFVESRARVSPESGAQWIEVAGAYAMYDGKHSPITQTFGLGIFQPPREADMDQLEAFFRDRGAPVFHEVSPMADKSLLPVLNARGYKPAELTSVMFLPLSERPEVEPPNARVQVRMIADREQEIWARTSAEGWSEQAEFATMILDLSRVVAATADALHFLAELDGRPIATGALSIHKGVALLAGASTIPEERKQGAQRALLESRLRHAADSGCDLAMMCAEPGSSSQRNAERQGFRVAYTRIKWERE